MKTTLLFFLLLFHHSLAQDPNIHTCTPNRTTSPCQTYAFYRAMAPDFLDLATIGDLFSVSRLMISNPSNITSQTTPLLPNQPLFIPLTCSCNSINTTLSLSFANLTYTIKKGDNFYLVSIHSYQNLTNYQSVQIVNPTLVPTLLQIGVNVVFPIACMCPNATQLQNGTSYLITYVFQPFDTLTSVALMFGVNIKDIVDLNGDRIRPFDVIFVPVIRLPTLKQPDSASSSKKGNGNRGIIIGLGIGLGFSSFLLVLVCGLWGYREGFLKKRRGIERDEEEERNGIERDERDKGMRKEMEENLMADVSDCLDKYRVFGIEELREATDGFDQRWVIQGSVYRGCIGGEMYAIKKMKWNACEELKILQKVNHGNLVKLEGFCIDLDDANCYLVYEYVEKGSLYSFLHDNKKAKLNWKTRLRIAIDVANGLQYIHEHTRPRVVHKDIKTSNILLDTNMRAKIANFGLAKSGCNAITTHIKGTQGYIAPEYLSNGLVSTKMDVFSFGVVLLELVSGREAVDGDGNVLWATVDGVLEERDGKKGNYRLKEWMDEIFLGEACSMESVMNVMGVAIACLHKDPSKRPSMVEIVYALCKSEDLVFDVSEDGISPRQVIIAR